MHGRCEGPLVGQQALGYGFMLGLAEDMLDVVQFGAVGRQVFQVKVLCPQIRESFSYLCPTVDAGIVHDHNTRDAGVRRQGMLQEVDQVLALPGLVSHPLGQGWRCVFGFGIGRSQNHHLVQPLSLGALVRDNGPPSPSAPGAGGGQAGIEACLVEEEEVQLPVVGFFLGSPASPPRLPPVPGPADDAGCTWCAVRWLPSGH